MKANKNYLKIFILLATTVGLFYLSRTYAGDRNNPAPVITHTNITVINDNNIPQIKTEIEIKNNGKKGFIVLEAKAVAGEETWEQSINLLMKSRKKHSLHFLFDERDIVNKNPEFSFYVYPF